MWLAWLVLGVVVSATLFMWIQHRKRNQWVRRLVQSGRLCPRKLLVLKLIRQGVEKSTGETFTQYRYNLLASTIGAKSSSWAERFLNGELSDMETMKEMLVLMREVNNPSEQILKDLRQGGIEPPPSANASGG